MEESAMYEEACKLSVERALARAIDPLDRSGLVTPDVERSRI